jgi:hypothetical protein
MPNLNKKTLLRIIIAYIIIVTIIEIILPLNMTWVYTNIIILAIAIFLQFKWYKVE